MPRHDRMGPAGQGPRTGWGYGPCEHPEIPPHEEILRKLDEVLEKIARMEKEIRRLD